jgi:hypothetical protein
MPKIGKIIEPSRGNIRDHERRTARSIANTGLTVEFILESTQDLTKSPDLVIDGVHWEMKSPTTDKLKQIENNLKKANRQSKNIIIDSQRVRRIPDKKIQAFLLARLQSQKSIERLLFVNRRREVIDINALMK